MENQTDPTTTDPPPPTTAVEVTAPPDAASEKANDAAGNDDTMTTVSDSTVEEVDVSATGGADEADARSDEQAGEAIAALLGGLLRLGVTASREGQVEEEEGANAMLEATKAGLDAYDLNYTVHPVNSFGMGPHDRVVTLEMNRRDAGQMTVYILMDSADDKFRFWLKYHVRVPEQHRVNVALYYTYVNWRLSVGSFELDMDDGEARFKYAHYLKDSQLSKAMVQIALELALKMAEQFFPGLMAVTYGGKDPKAAYEECFQEAASEQVEQAQ